jgi:predicted hexulose-6-phosphate isomerase
MLKLRDLPFGLYEKSICSTLSWEDKFTLIKDAGYDYFEIAIDATPEKLGRLENRGEQLRIRRASEALDTPLYTLAFTANRFYPLGSEDASVRTEGIRLCKRAIDFASFVGAKTINIASYDEYEKPRNKNTEGLFLDSIKECVEHASIRGVIISLETMDSSFIDTTQKALHYVRAIDSAFLQIGVDPGNISAMGHNPITDIPAGGRHIVEVEFKDTRPGVVRDIFFGEGTVDFEACFRMLHEIQYQGFLAAEMWSHDDPAYHPNIYKGAQFLKAKMADY